MQDKRTALAIFLIITFVLVYSELFLAPPARPPAQAPSATPVNTTGTISQSAQNNPNTSQVPQTLEATDQQRAPSVAEVLASAATTIETEKMKLKLQHLGARFSEIDLKEYTQRLGDPTPLNLVVANETGPLPLGIYYGAESDMNTTYSVESVTTGITNQGDLIRVGAGQEASIVLKGVLPSGIEVRKTLKLSGDSYLVGVDIALSKVAAAKTNIWLEWSEFIREEQLHERYNWKNITALTSDTNKINHLDLTEVGTEPSEPMNVLWIGIADTYFTATTIPSETGLNARMLKTPVSTAGNVYQYRLKGGEQAASYTLYVGPKDFKVLQGIGFQLDRSIDLGFFSFLAYPLLMLMRFFHSFIGNWGLAIVVLTLFIKTVFFPLNRASLKSMKAMQELQPEMKALRERIKDPTQLNQEMLGLYKKRGVNPMGGCLPMLIQIPVFFGLFSALQNSIELRHAPYAIWIHDLSAPEHLIFPLFGGINVPVLSIVMALVIFVQQYFTPAPGMDPSQRKMMLIMSGMFGLMFIIFPFPAGLALYMLVNTLISLFQQSFLKDDTKVNPFAGTILASVGIFAGAYVLTLLH